MDDILVSINCITYNHEKYIDEAIESFLMQKTNFKFEILIHDDASTDKTPQIIKQYQKKYPDIIKPIFQKENQYSKGIKSINYKFNYLRSKGKYIALCEGDDYWTDPLKLQKQVEYMEEHGDCSMCFHAATVVKVGKGKNGQVKPYNKNCIAPVKDIILGDGGFIATNSILYRKSIMDDPPQFYLEAPIGDYPLQIIASTKKYAYYINELMSVYRVGVEGSWSNRMSIKENREEKYIELKNQVINILLEFNRYSQGKYFQVVKRKIIEDEFEISIINKRLKKKTFDESLGIVKKIKIYLRYYFPNIYKKLVELKRVIK